MLNVTYILKLECWSLYHSLSLKYQETRKKNDGTGSVFERLNYYNKLGGGGLHREEQRRKFLRLRNCIMANK